MTRSKNASRSDWDINEFQSYFPALSASVQGKKMIYLDNACTALKSRPVVKKMEEFCLYFGVCGGKRSTHLLSQEAESQIQDCHSGIADFIGAESSKEIVFTSGTTESANLLAQAFPYTPKRREVIITDLEHNSVFLPFYNLHQQGKIKLKICPSQNGHIDLNKIKEMISDKTALVAATRASNVLGGTQPLAQICQLAHRWGTLVFSDEAQHLSSHRENVASLNVDFAAFSAHKLGGPFGFGVLYGKENLLNRLLPSKVGGGTVKSVTWKRSFPEVIYLDAPEKFEAGIQNWGAAIGTLEAIRVLNAIPQSALRSHISGLVRYAAEELSKFPEVKILGEIDHLTQGALVSFYPTHPNFSLQDFNLFLNHELGPRFIAARIGEHCAHLIHQRLKIPSTMRISFFAYNTKKDIAFFLEALKSYAHEACGA